MEIERCKHGLMVGTCAMCDKTEKIGIGKQLLKEAFQEVEQENKIGEMALIPIDEIYKMVNEFNNNAVSDMADPVYRSAIIMLAGVSVTQRIQNIRKLTGYDYQFIKFVKKNLRKAEIWDKKDGYFTFDLSFIDALEENEPEKAICMFWLFAMAGAGVIEKTGEYYKSIK